MKAKQTTVRKRTTVYMNLDLHKELHISAIRQSRTVAECLEEAIADFVEKYEKIRLKKNKED